MIPLGITDSACKNRFVVVSVQYGPFNPYIPIRSTTIGKSRVSIDPIAMHTSWRSNSDIASVTRSTSGFQFFRWNALESERIFREQNLLARTIAAKCGGGGGGRRGEFAEYLFVVNSFTLKHKSTLARDLSHYISSDCIRYPRTRASGESSTTKHRLHMLRDLTQSRHLMTLTESVNESNTELLHCQLAKRHIGFQWVSTTKAAYTTTVQIALKQPAHGRRLLQASSSAQNCSTRQHTPHKALSSDTPTSHPAAQHSTVLICHLASDLVQLATTQQASKLNSTNHTSSALRAAAETPATLNSLLFYDQHRPQN
ncbi:hypothetical protein F511_40237 [Dorcoceras hygrometricum]|uniref:Uncharacterized protein n=1 Tax=Dorcoceras hygrometricum TaxID=472368 RepID=A0A2Z7AW83_9LAMI|nr:hypothetical protein F511_40237 [Dorcoceras hygrometricum]